MLDSYMVLLIGQVIVVWFLREEGIELRGGPKFGSGGSVGTKAKAEGREGSRGVTMTKNMTTNSGRITLY